MAKKSFYQRLSEDERDRIFELENDFEKGNKIPAHEIFNSKIVSRLLTKGSNIFMNCGGWNHLHYFLPFYDRIIVRICPGCSYKKDLDILKFYLDNKIILPALTGHYEEYSKDFVDLILSHHHISYDSLDFYFMYSNNTLINSFTCPHCFYKPYYSSIEKSLSSIRYKILREMLQDTFEMVASLRLNKEVMIKFEILLRKGDIDGINKLDAEIRQMYTFSLSRSLSSSFSINLNDLNNYKKYLSKDNPLLGIIPEYNRIVFDGLKINSPTDKPSVNYLSILLKYKKQVSNIVKQIPKNKLKESNLSKLKRNFEDINSEVYDLRESKRGKFYQFLTNFVNSKKELIKASILRVADPSGNIPQDLTNLDLNSVSPKLNEFFSEKFLLIYFRKPLPTIQLWSLQNKISKIKK